MSKTNLTYPAYTLADVDKAKLELLQEIHRRLKPRFEDDACSVLEIELMVNDTLSNIHKEHKLG